MKKSMQIAFSGILCALSVALLFFGSVIWILSYVMPIISGLLMIIIIENIDKKTAWSVYACTSIISLIMLPDKECVLIYMFFFGYYPIIKDSLCKIKNRFILLLSKLLIFNLSIIASQLVCIYVFGIPFDNFLGKWGIIILIILSNVVFYFYERMIRLLFVLYDKKYKKYIEKMFQK